MPRTIRKDTKIIKVDLERLLNKAECFIKSPRNFWSKLKYGLLFAASVYTVYDGYKDLSQKVYADNSVSNKKSYFSQAIREGANHLTEMIISRYI